MSWADELTPEERANFDAWKHRKDSSAHGWADMLAEFGYYYGWEAIRDVLNDEVSAGTFIQLLEAGRRFYQKDMTSRMVDTYNAFGATQSKQANRKFQRMVKERANG